MKKRGDTSGIEGDLLLLLILKQATQDQKQIPRHPLTRALAPFVKGGSRPMHLNRHVHQFLMHR